MVGTWSSQIPAGAIGLYFDIDSDYLIYNLIVTIKLIWLKHICVQYINFYSRPLHVNYLLKNYTHSYYNENTVHPFLMFVPKTVIFFCHGQLQFTKSIPCELVNTNESEWEVRGMWRWCGKVISVSMNFQKNSKPSTSKL